MHIYVMRLLHETLNWSIKQVSIKNVQYWKGSTITCVLILMIYKIYNTKIPLREHEKGIF